MQVLQTWQERLHDSANVERALGHVQEVLALRSSTVAGGGGQTSLQQVVSQVQGLVEGEARVRATHDAFASVERELREHPQGGLQRVVKHFQDLFGVSSVEGCLPTMSKVSIHAAAVSSTSSAADQQHWSVRCLCLSSSGGVPEHGCLLYLCDGLRWDAGQQQDSWLHNYDLPVDRLLSGRLLSVHPVEIRPGGWLGLSGWNISGSAALVHRGGR